MAYKTVQYTTIIITMQSDRCTDFLPGIVGDGVGDGVASASVVNVPSHEPTTVLSLAVALIE